MRARKLLPLIIIVIIIPLALASCEGIGDGALIGDIELDGERIVCTVEAYTYDHRLRDSFKMDGTPANELFAYFTESEFEYEALEGDLMMKPYIVVYFERYNLKGEKLSDVEPDSGLKYEYRVFADDELMQKFSDKQGYQTLGYPDGVYQKLVDLFAVRSASNGYFCSIANDYAEVAFVTVDAKKGYEMHKLLTEGEYLTDIERTDDENAYFVINYSGASDKSYLVYEDDFVYEYYLSLDSNNSDPFKLLGRASGLYAKAKSLFESSLYTLRDKDVAASGVWLTRIDVRTKPGEYSVYDFVDVGCIYIIEEEENYYSLFFYDTNEYYYDRAIATLEAREDIVEVIPINVHE